MLTKQTVFNTSYESTIIKKEQNKNTNTVRNISVITANHATHQSLNSTTTTGITFDKNCF